MDFHELCSEHRCTRRERIALWAHLCLLRYQKALHRLWEHDRAMHAATKRKRK